MSWLDRAQITNLLFPSFSLILQIFQAGSLPLLLCMLEAESVEEQGAAAQAIWTLSFDELVRQNMLKDEACLNILKKATQSDREQVHTAAKGALWIIQRTSTSKSK